MLARLALAIGEDLLRELAVGLGGDAVGSYFNTDMPFTGASANRTVLRMREAKTRSPKFSSRISIASLAWIVRESTNVGRIPSMSTVGFRFSRIIARVFWSCISPRMDRYSHCTGTITLSAAVRALIVSRPRLGGVSMQMKS